MRRVAARRRRSVSGGPTDNAELGRLLHLLERAVRTDVADEQQCGRQQPDPAYSGFVGTSPATPQVAGVAALLKSFVPDATPAQISSYLLTNVRAYPAGSVCAAGGTFAGQCGTGLLDAEKALTAAGPLASPASVAGTDQVVAPGATVTLNGSASKAYASKTITSYQWTQTGGTPTVTLATPTAATTTFTAPATGCADLPPARHRQQHEGR